MTQFRTSPTNISSVILNEVKNLNRFFPNLIPRKKVIYRVERGEINTVYYQRKKKIAKI